MKKLLSITLIILMFFVGCSNPENIITSPTYSDTPLSGSIHLESLTSTAIKEELINSATITKLIDGTLGGKVALTQKVYSSEGRLVEVNSKFEVTAGAFIGAQNITMSVNVDNGCVSFYPEMTFKQTCYLNYAFQNMNLANLGFKPGDKKADFVYFNDNNRTIEPVLNMGVNLIYNKGNLQVQKGQINHFSRYGFIRVAE